MSSCDCSDCSESVKTETLSVDSDDGSSLDDFVVDDGQSVIHSARTFLINDYIATKKLDVCRSFFIIGCVQNFMSFQPAQFSMEFYMRFVDLISDELKKNEFHWP